MTLSERLAARHAQQQQQSVAAPARTPARRRVAAPPRSASDMGNPISPPAVMSALITDGLSRLAETEDRRAEASRDGAAYIHVSTLSGGAFCPRAHVLLHRHGSGGMIGDSPSSAQRLVWALGRAAETHLRRQLIAALGVARVLGVWSCPCGASVVRGFGDHGHVCTVCQQPLLIYGEFHILDEELRVSGSPDFIFAINDTLVVVEIKSRKLDAFLVTQAPDGTHVVQASLYRTLLERHRIAGYTIHPQVQVMYVAKDYPRPGVRPYKDFVCDPAATITNVLLAEAAQAAPALALSADVVVELPSRLTACSSADTRRASRCAACTLCFL